MTQLRTIDDLPSPKGLPLLGNITQIKPEQFHIIVEDWVKTHGETLLIKLGRKPVVVISNPEMMTEIFRERPHRYRRWTDFESLAKEQGMNGLFTVEGEDWQRQRRAWMKALSVHQVKPFFQRIDEITERLRQRWLKAAKDGAIIDLGADLMHYTVDVTTLFAFGIDTNTLEQDDDAMHEHLRRVATLMSRRAKIPIPYWRWFRLPSDRQLDASMDFLKTYINGVIADARVRLQNNPTPRETPTNLLEALLVTTQDDGSPFSDEEIFANTLMALTAGEDTTAHAISWIIHFLIQNPEPQAQLRAEVDEVLGEEPRWTNIELASRLQGIDCAMSEALRMKPVVPLVMLSTNEDTVLGDLQLPKGTDLILAPRVTAMNDDHYADAETFCPARWQHNQKKYTTQPPMPFGGGPRLCPGRSLAQTEIKSVIAMLLRNFEIEMAHAEPVTETMTLTLIPENLQIKLSARD